MSDNACGCSPFFIHDKVEHKGILLGKKKGMSRVIIYNAIPLQLIQRKDQCEMLDDDEKEILGSMLPTINSSCFSYFPNDLRWLIWNYLISICRLCHKITWKADEECTSCL